MSPLLGNTIVQALLAAIAVPCVVCVPVLLGLAFAGLYLVSIKEVAATRRYEPWYSSHASMADSEESMAVKETFHGGSFWGDSTLGCFFWIHAFSGMTVQADAITLQLSLMRQPFIFAKDEVVCVLTRFTGGPAIRFLHHKEGYPQTIALFQNYRFLGRSRDLEEAMRCLADHGFQCGVAA